MNTRVLLICFLTLICLGVIGALVAQRRELANLRSDHQRFLAQLAESPNAALSQQTGIPAGDSPEQHSPSLELLKLRNTVTQLMRQKNELASTRGENERLQLAARGTNYSITAVSPLPPDYIRARDAQWVGTSTIENTIQSFFWALRHRDTNALFQVLTVRSGRQLSEQIQNTSADELFKEAAIFPGMRIAERKQLPDGTLEAKIEMLPGKAELNSFHFQLVQGQWKLDLN